MRSEPRENIVEKHGPVLPAIDPYIHAASLRLACAVCVTVQMHGTIKGSLPSAQRIVAAHHAIFAARPTAKSEHFMDLIEESLQSLSRGVVVASHKFDRLARDARADFRRISHAFLSFVTLPDSRSREVTKVQQAIAAVHPRVDPVEQKLVHRTCVIDGDGSREKACRLRVTEVRIRCNPNAPRHQLCAIG